MSVQALQQAVVDAEAALDREMERLRRTCQHPNIIEVEYYSGILTTFPPYRVCRTCGIREEGWGAGYHILARGLFGSSDEDKLIPRVSRDDAHKFITVPTEEWVWCYGSRTHLAHGCPKADLTKGRMDGRPDGAPMRCKDYEED